jgi:putative PIN family toxin of toxin-antitoxin system
MRAVADTNVVVSALLWHGPPRQVLDRARTGQVELFTSAALLEELSDVLGRTKIAARVKATGTEPHELVAGYAALARLIAPEVVEPVIAADPDDDMVLACAVAAHAQVIISGDKDLLALKEYRRIRVLRAREVLARIG